jgi:hypothetical protein
MSFHFTGNLNAPRRLNGCPFLLQNAVMRLEEPSGIVVNSYFICFKLRPTLAS